MTTTTTTEIDEERDTDKQPIVLLTGPRAFFTGKCDLPPGINASYDIVSVKTKMGKEAHTLAATEALKQFKSDASFLLTQGYHDWALINAIREAKRKVPLRMEIHFFFKTLWKADIDGGIKAVMDAVFQRLELNDVLVVDLHATKEVDPHYPRVEMEVYCFLPTTTQTPSF